MSAKSKGQQKRPFKDLLSEGQRPVRTIAICLRGDLVAELEEIERQLQEVNDQRGDSLDGGGDLGALAEQYEALRQEMREHVYTFRLRSLPKREFRDLVSSHPPRRIAGADGEMEIHERDKYVGINVDTFYDAIIRACLVDPELDDEDWFRLTETLTDKQFEDLSDAAWAVNRSDVDVPFSRAASLINRRTASE